MLDKKILIEKIQNHSKSVGDKITNPFIKAGYKLAHEHIVDIVHLLQNQNKTVEWLSICKGCFHSKVCKDYAFYKVVFTQKFVKITLFIKTQFFLALTFAKEG